MSIEFEVSSKTYRAEKMNAFKQLHVARKLAPVLSGLAPLFMSVSSAPDDANMAEVIAGHGESVLGPLAAAVSSMPDADAESIVMTCLDVVVRQDSGTWARVTAPGGGLMFQDIDLSEMLQITAKVIQDSLSGFFTGLPGASGGNGQLQKQ